VVDLQRYSTGVLSWWEKNKSRRRLLTRNWAGFRIYRIDKILFIL